ncbi:hypothetical protein LTR86_001286 [Recurvomyces mirabilis]|nr:hypothetical protein LTR86_001286 [Recurvomyces mirabilis]
MQIVPSSAHGPATASLPSDRVSGSVNDIPLSHDPHDKPPTATANDQQPQQENVTPYRDMSWATVFNHFMDTRQNHRRDVIDKCSITYLGESFPLALVLEDLREGGRTRLHHSGPPVGTTAISPADHDQGTHPPHIQLETVKYLEAKHVFELPSRSVYDELIITFLSNVFPLYPVVGYQEFYDQYMSNNLPWILIHACCFMATTFCSDELIHKCGFGSRKVARLAYYSKAKALVDVEYERNKIVLLQVTIMLTFWGGGPNDYWNTVSSSSAGYRGGSLVLTLPKWSWLSSAVTIAETLGIHRSLTGTNMAPKDRSLLKRLWWTLVIRDASCATLVGRPFRINMDHGDAEMPAIVDFEDDMRSLQRMAHPLADIFAHYQIAVTRLSLLLYDIDYARFIPGPKKMSMFDVYNALQTWRSDVPSCLDWTAHQNILCTCLSMLYDHHMMLACLGRSGSEVAASRLNGSDVGEGGPIAAAWPFSTDLAAQRISTHASSIITKSQALRIPHETYQAVFLAGIVSYVSMRNPNIAAAQLGRVILDNCNMVLHTVREAWDASPWVTALFDGLMAGLSNDPGLQHVGHGGVYVTGQNPAFSFDDIGASLSGYGMGVSWQSNPMLSALFDNS